MAEIKVEKKQATWPWIIFGIIIIVALIYFIFKIMEKEGVHDNPQAINLTSVNENNSAVAAFISFVNTDTVNMGLDHAYTHEALTRLTEAIEVVAKKRDMAVPAGLDMVEQYAAEITKNPYETSHADNIRKAADILSIAIQNMQQVNYPSLGKEAAALKDAAATINPDVLTLNQKEAVKSFFKKAADLLQKMN
jgi:hypothetical protein